MEIKLAKTANLIEECEKLNLKAYVVKRDGFIAASSKAELRKYRQVIYTTLPCDKKNPETWCAERMPIINKKLRKQEWVWDDQYLAKKEGLPVPL